MTMLNVSKIRVDPALQPRAQMDSIIIQEYAEAMQAGAHFPPVVVFQDAIAVYWLADGFHRLEAARRCQFSVIEADVQTGERREALLYSVGANATHGLRRTNADKRRSVETLLRDAEWAQWSDREIARRAGVSDRLVNLIRAELRPATTSDLQVRKVQRGGQEYTMVTEGIGARPVSANNSQIPVATPVAPAVLAAQTAPPAPALVPAAPVAPEAFTALATPAASQPALPPDWGTPMMPQQRAVMLTARLEGGQVRVTVYHEGMLPLVVKNGGRAEALDLMGLALAEFLDLMGLALAEFEAKASR